MQVFSYFCVGVVLPCRANFKHMNLKSILIVSNFFAPENTPRAFRVAALVERMAASGVRVTVVLPNKQVYHENPYVREGVKLLFADGPIEKAPVNLKRKSSGSFLPRWVRETILFFVSHEYFFKYNKGLERTLMGVDESFDMLLSVSYPVAIHRAVTKAVKRNKRLKFKVLAAEFSDPPFRNEYWRKIFFCYKNILRRWGRRFDFFITPTSLALDCYTPYIAPERIKIIPQGFDLRGFEQREYRPHRVPTFAYAGRFYENVRDPEFLFKYLCSLERDFRFELYVNVVDSYFDALIDKYIALSRGRIIRCTPQPREQLISHLSSLDFLVNLEYTMGDASPIKLIDYGMSGRPIISFREANFEPSRLESFLDGDYSAAVEFDMAPYDIDTVVAQFDELMSL